eukprot:CAMPEP_0181234994 /NCGR_PEP_ID=MMETSP1096-20121128/37313_1 /TAXON_ID=156174 ORGANISM="Chrysochromulina ericina, Strain CCMP281" /NCGR_SAMPLE_ID=MMETSP1096 /ASSEMBLY_ACC=CAM_ASM_000453 /LENGTH=192 /DNA_ID=CAMNT_0023329893 /DNA_START=117 /DNA_END=695 /DNA_ORIENTATION=-
MSMSVPGCRCACGLLRGGVIRRRREATTTTAIYQTYSPPASRSRRWRSNLWLPGILSGILSGMLPGMLPCLLPQHCKHHTNEGSRRDEDRIFPLILVEEHRVVAHAAHPSEVPEHCEAALRAYRRIRGDVGGDGIRGRDQLEDRRVRRQENHICQPRTMDTNQADRARDPMRLLRDRHLRGAKDLDPDPQWD